MLQESTEPLFKIDNKKNYTNDKEEEIWTALTDSKISLSLSALLKLVPHFTDKVAHIIAQNKTEEVVVNFTNLTLQRSAVIDEHNP